MTESKPQGWSKDWPTEDGWYWMRRCDSTVATCEFTMDRVWIGQLSYNKGSQQMDGCEFLGPITPSDHLKAAMHDELVETLSDLRGFLNVTPLHLNEGDGITLSMLISKARALLDRARGIK